MQRVAHRQLVEQQLRFLLASAVARILTKRSLRCLSQWYQYHSRQVLLAVRGQRGVAMWVHRLSQQGLFALGAHAEVTRQRSAAREAALLHYARETGLDAVFIWREQTRQWRSHQTALRWHLHRRRHAAIQLWKGVTESALYQESLLLHELRTATLLLCLNRMSRAFFWWQDVASEIALHRGALTKARERCFSLARGQAWLRWRTLTQAAERRLTQIAMAILHGKRRTMQAAWVRWKRKSHRHRWLLRKRAAKLERATAFLEDTTLMGSWGVWRLRVETRTQEATARQCGYGAWHFRQLSRALQHWREVAGEGKARAIQLAMGVQEGNLNLLHAGNT